MPSLEDKQALPCIFEAGQLRNGDVLLLCDFLTPAPFLLSISAHKFEGTTSDGFNITAVENIMEINYLPDTPTGRSGMWAAFYLRQMTVQMATGVASEVRVGITNFSCTIGFSLELEHMSGLITLSIKRIKEYSKVILRLQTLKNVDVTCEVIGNISLDSDIEYLKKVVDDLCYLLSVARGTKIQWIYCDQYEATGTRLSRLHTSRITKAYHSLPIIEPKDDNETKQFIEEAFRTYTAKRDPYKFERIIDSFLDATAEHDHLQPRGIKLAVTMEALKDVFLKLPDVVKGGEYILDDDFFNKHLKPQIVYPLRYILSFANVEGADQDAICSKLSELNRKTFRYVLNKLFEHIDLNIDKKDLGLFILCRNSLVHTGGFLSETATQKDKKRYKQLSNVVTEYFFLVDILNKMMMKLLGYSGPYLDWSLPGNPIRKDRI